MYTSTIAKHADLNYPYDCIHAQNNPHEQLLFIFVDKLHDYSVENASNTNQGNNIILLLIASLLVCLSLINWLNSLLDWIAARLEEQRIESINGCFR